MTGRDDGRGLDLTGRCRIHVVNVGGAGMSAIAQILAEMGHTVSGVDTADDTRSPFLAPLRSAGVTVTVGSAGLDGSPDAVVVSTATPADHADVVAARARGVPVLHRADLLEQICALRTVTAVSGTHGKSTTAGMLATIHEGVGSGAGFLVGTRVTGLGANAAWRRGPGFVVEADESDGTFLRLRATHVVVTNQEPDHLSNWGTAEALEAGFDQFVGAATGSAVLCVDDPGSARLVDGASRPVTYGTDPGADFVVSDVAPAGIGVRFRLTHPGGSVEVSVPSAPGIHNARNATAAIAAAAADGIEPERAADALSAFAGVARRFEQRGVAGGVTFVDSYDHLPTEIRAALAAARTGPFDRVVCVFQPHRYTRTRDLAATFGDAFADADLVAVTELYPAGEAPIPGVSGRLVHDAVLAADPGRPVEFLPDLAAAEDWLVGHLRPGDLCLTLNAGDLTVVPDRVMARLNR